MLRKMLGATVVAFMVANCGDRAVDPTAPAKCEQVELALCELRARCYPGANKMPYDLEACVANVKPTCADNIYISPKYLQCIEDLKVLACEDFLEVKVTPIPPPPPPPPPPMNPGGAAGHAGAAGGGAGGEAGFGGLAGAAGAPGSTGSGAMSGGGGEGGTNSAAGAAGMSGGGGEGGMGGASGAAGMSGAGGDGGAPAPMPTEIISVSEKPLPFYCAKYSF
jgi:hypothetical protein